MRPWRAIVFLLLACALWGGTEPRPKASDYPAHAELPGLSLGAEYLVRSFSGGNKTFSARDHLVVEIAVYPAKGQTIAVSSGHFSLRLTGKKKETLVPQGPEFVAAGFRYPEWEMRPRLEGVAGAGEGAVILGRPQPVERFPGDPRPSQGRLPAPPRAPEPEDRGGVEKEPPARADEVVVRTALPEGDASGAISGFLYFPYKGKTKSIRSAELVYQGPAGAATLKLF